MGNPANRGFERYGGGIASYTCPTRTARASMSIEGQAEFDEHSMRTVRVGIGAKYAAEDGTGRTFDGPGHVFYIHGSLVGGLPKITESRTMY